jgi:hypothetical protein
MKNFWTRTAGMSSNSQFVRIENEKQETLLKSQQSALAPFIGIFDEAKSQCDPKKLDSDLAKIINTKTKRQTP